MQTFQFWLDQGAATIFAEDFEGYARLMEVPLLVITNGASLNIPDEEQLAAGFRAMTEMIRGLQATEIIRIATEVHPIGAELICGRYATHILRNGHRLFEAFATTAILRRHGPDSWRAVVVANALANREWPIHLPRLDPRATLPDELAELPLPADDPLPVMRAGRAPRHPDLRHQPMFSAGF